MFRFYSTTFSQATRGMAATLFSIGLILVGFGVLIIVFPAVFAFIASLFFFIVGAAFLSFAIKAFIAFRRIGRDIPSENHRRYIEIDQWDSRDNDD